MYITELVGIIPAAGTASRLNPIPCSKELFPIGVYGESNVLRGYPKPVCMYTIENMKEAGIENIYITIRKGKWDIPHYLGDGKKFGVNIAYLVMGLSYGAPFSINQAFPFIAGKNVALGYPDIIIEQKGLYTDLYRQLRSSDACIVLALFNGENCKQIDMVELDKNGNIIRIDIKPPKSDLQYTWMGAVWKPSFSEYLNNTLGSGENINKTDEFYFGNVLNSALNDGLKIGYSLFPHGRYIDIGTPENINQSIKLYSSQ